MQVYYAKLYRIVSIYITKKSVLLQDFFNLICLNLIRLIEKSELVRLLKNPIRQI